MKRYIFIVIMILLLVPHAFAETGKVDRAGFPSDTSIAIDKAHREIHEGHSYCSSFNATLASGAATTFLVNTPAGNIVGHLIMSLRSSGESNIKVYEGATVSALGTVMQETQHNRNSSRAALIEITRAPTVTSLGTVLDGFEFHVGAGQTRGGEARGISELVMKPSTLYIINGISEASSNDVTLSIDWYEDRVWAP